MTTKKSKLKVNLNKKNLQTGVKGSLSAPLKKVVGKRGKLK